MQITLDGYVAGPNDEADWLITGDDEWTDLFKDLRFQVFVRNDFNIQQDILRSEKKGC